jgi:hypothetical protein
MVVFSGFQQVGGEAVAQGVDAPAPLEAGGALGPVVDPLNGGDVQRMVAVLTREQPRPRPVQRPIRPQLGEQTTREHAVAVLAALALTDADGHPVAVNVGELQVDDLADPQPRGVGGHEQDPMLGIAGSAQEPLDLLGAQDLRQPALPLARRQRELQPVPLQDSRVQEREGIDGDVAGAPGQLPLYEQVVQVVLDLSRGQAIRRLPVECGQALNRMDVRQLGLGCQPVQLHLPGHLCT